MGFWANIISSAKAGELSFQVGIAQWLAVGLSLLVAFFLKIKMSKKNIPASLVSGFVISILMMLDFSLPFWKLITKIIEVDFPFRFMLPAVFTSSLLAGFAIANLNKVFRGVLFILLILVALYTNRNHTKVNLYTNLSVKDYVDAEFTTSSMNEYLPPWADTAVFMKKLNSPLEPEGIPVANLERNTQKLSFEANLSKETQVSVNHFDYPGIALNVDGQKRDYARDSYGRITTTLSEGTHKISVVFEDTTPIKVGKIISLVAIVVFLLLLL